MKTDRVRERTLEDISDFYGENKSSSVMKSCDHAMRDARRKRDALEYLETHVAGQHVRKVAEILSTPHIPIGYEVEIDVGPKNRHD